MQGDRIMELRQGNGCTIWVIVSIIVVLGVLALIVGICSSPGH